MSCVNIQQATHRQEHGFKTAFFGFYLPVCLFPVCRITPWCSSVPTNLIKRTSLGSRTPLWSSTEATRTARESLCFYYFFNSLLPFKDGAGGSGHQSGKEPRELRLGSLEPGFVSRNAEPVLKTNHTGKIYIFSVLFLVFKSPCTCVSRFTICHKSEVVKNTLNPVWQAFSIPVRALCNGDYERWDQCAIMRHAHSNTHCRSVTFQ